MEAAPRSTVGPAWSDHDVYAEPDATSASLRHVEHPAWTDDDAGRRAGGDDFDDQNPGGSYVGIRTYLNTSISTHVPKYIRTYVHRT